MQTNELLEIRPQPDHLVLEQPALDVGRRRGLALRFRAVLHRVAKVAHHVVAAIGKPSRRMPGIWRRTPRPMLTDILALAISI